MEEQKISSELKSRFGWLAGENTKVAEQLLRHFLKLTVVVKKAAAAVIMQQMDRDRAANSDFIRDVVSTIRVRKHEVQIKRTEAVEAIGSVDRWTFQRGGRKQEIKSGGGFNWLVWLLLGIGVIWFLSKR